MAPKSCRPSDGDRSKWTIVQRNPLRMTPWKSIFVEDAIRRLSKSDYNLLESFRNVFPSLHAECCPRPCNAFMLYRSHYVASIDTEGPSNQKDLSKDASRMWNTVVDQGPYLVWADDIRKLWYRMYPGRHLPSRVREELNKQIQKTKGPSSKRLQSNEARRKKIQHYPSPSVSEVADSAEDSTKSYGQRKGSEGKQTSGTGDEEYLPDWNSPYLASISSKQKYLDEYQLPTPALTIRELSPSPTPVFFDTAILQSPQLSPTFHNISLAEFNYDDDPEYSTFLTARMLPDFPSSAYDPFNHPNQIAVGYSIKEHATNTIVDWDQAGLMSDLDPVSLHPTIVNTNIPYPDVGPDPTTEVDSRLDLSSFSLYELSEA